MHQFNTLTFYIYWSYRDSFGLGGLASSRMEWSVIISPCLPALHWAKPLSTLFFAESGFRAFQKHTKSKQGQAGKKQGGARHWTRMLWDMTTYGRVGLGLGVGWWVGVLDPVSVCKRTGHKPEIALMGNRCGVSEEARGWGSAEQQV